MTEQTVFSLLGKSVGWAMAGRGCWSSDMTSGMLATCQRMESCRLGAQGQITGQEAFTDLVPSHFLTDPLSLPSPRGLSHDLAEAAIQCFPSAFCFGEADPSDRLFHECFQIGCLHLLQQVILCLWKIDQKTSNLISLVRYDSSVSPIWVIEGKAYRWLVKNLRLKYRTQ